MSVRVRVRVRVKVCCQTVVRVFRFEARVGSWAEGRVPGCTFRL